VDTRSVLGLPAVRPAFLDDVSPARAAQAKTRGTDAMMLAPAHEDHHPPAVWFDDEVDDDIDDESEDDFDDDEDEDAEEDDGDEEEPETWQVRGRDLG
jgi:hypothetical protein